METYPCSVLSASLSVQAAITANIMAGPRRVEGIYLDLDGKASQLPEILDVGLDASPG